MLSKIWSLSIWYFSAWDSNFWVYISPDKNIYVFAALNFILEHGGTIHVQIWSNSAG